MNAAKLSCASILTLVTALSTASAAEAPGVTPGVTPAAPPVVTRQNTGSISLNLGMDWTNQYYFRGIVQETEGVLLQPYFDARLALYTSERLLSHVALAVGLWNSLHTGPSGSSGNDPGSSAPGMQTADPKAWYESDAFATLSVGLLQKLSLDLTYTAYVSPNKAFGSTQELTFGLAYDDSSLFASLWGGRFGGLQPSAGLSVELSGGAMGEPGTFLLLGLSPAIKLLDREAVTLSAGIPLELGLGLGDYYDAPNTGARDTFGYLQTGATVSVGLGFIPRRLGAWALSAGARVLVLGDLLTEVNGDRRAEFIAHSGLAIGY